MIERVAAVAVAVPFVLGTLAAPASGRDVVFRFQDPEIVESSGLVIRNDLFVTTNDSGDTGRVFTVDPATGETVSVTTWPGEPDDVEALAPAGRDDVWVGDIGDNSRDRSSVSVTRLPVATTDLDVTGETFELRYPDGPADAETLLAEPGSGRLLVATKGILGGTLYAAPELLRSDRPNRLQELGGILPVATDGAFFPDGRHLVLRDYGRAVVYTYPGLEQVAELELPDQEQGEAIAVDDDARVYVTSEGVNAPVLEVKLPRALRTAVVAPGPSPSPTASPTPPSSVIEIQTEQEAPGRRDAGQWLLGTALFVVAVVVLILAVRPRPSRPRR